MLKMTHNVDTDTGIVYTAGFDESGNRYVTHPNSGVPIVGFQIPRWNEAKSLAIRMRLKYEGSKVKMKLSTKEIVKEWERIL